jgi:cytidine deaminase
MTTIVIPNHNLEIHPIQPGNVESVLDVYRQCEDFLALGPVSTASMEMVLKDLEISQSEGGIFCGIYRADGKMIAVVDYVPSNFEGNPQTAYLSLLMIAAPFRNQGIGQAILEAIENEIKKDAEIRTIRAGVQVNNPQAIWFWQKKGYQIVSGPKLMPDQTTVFDLRKDLSLEKEPATTEVSNLELIDRARRVLKPRELSLGNSAGDVGCALLSAGGNIYLGVCIDVSSGIGFCAEHSAIAAMITAGETSISKIVAVWGDNTILPPCGRCREFMYEIDTTNLESTEVILGEHKAVKLKDLLPHPYHEVWNK